MELASGAPDLIQDAEHNLRQHSPDQDYFFHSNVAHRRYVVVKVRVAIKQSMPIVIDEQGRRQAQGRRSLRSHAKQEALPLEFRR